MGMAGTESTISEPLLESSASEDSQPGRGDRPPQREAPAEENEPWLYTTARRFRVTAYWLFTCGTKLCWVLIGNPATPCMRNSTVVSVLLINESMHFHANMVGQCMYIARAY